MNFSPDELPYFHPRIDRRVALITAGNSGVGWYTVLHLYLHGYVVYLAGRPKTRCMKAIAEVEQEARRIHKTSAASHTLGELHFLEVDLASLASVSDAVRRFKDREINLNILINNAGVMAKPHTVTPDGFEVQLQTNYVAPFLLTTKLLPLLERTADLYPHIEPPRVLYLSLVGHQLVVRYFNLGTMLNYQPNFLFTWIRYGLAKTAGIHFMRMLALRNPRVLCVSVQPGWVMNPNYFSYWTRLPIIGIVFWCLFQIFGFFFGVTVEQGSYALLRVSLDPSLTLEADNGAHFGAFGEKADPSKVARNMDYAARSWIWTVHQMSKRHIDIAR